MPRRVPLVVSVPAAALCIALGQPIPADAASPPPSGWFGNVYLSGSSSSFDARKVFVVSYRVAEGSAEVTDVAVAYGAPPALPPARRDYLLELIGADGSTLSTRPAADPRLAIVEREGNVMLPRGLLSVRFDFNRAGAKVRLRDGQGKTLADADLSRAIDLFCARNTDDPDCKAIAESRRAPR